MNRTMLRSAVLILASSAVAASAQMTVHAVTGSVKTVTPHNLSVMVDSSSGSASKFKIAPSAKLPSEFSHDLRADSTAPESFQKVGDFALVYYYGYGDSQTAVAVKDLGAGPFTKARGTVIAFDKHSRTLTLKDDTGKRVPMLLNDQVVVDTDTGVDSGRKFSPHKGDLVRVTYSAGAPATVAFIGELK
jgi:hypothetical protein